MDSVVAITLTAVAGAILDDPQNQGRGAILIDSGCLLVRKRGYFFY